jgi:hypothetical protein
MGAQFPHLDPFPSTQWRANRAVQLIERRLKPRRWDDRYVRTYRRFLLDCLAASGDERRLQAAELAWPDVCHAHKLHSYSDQEWPHLLEARLLTREPFDAIARRFDVPASAIDWYEKLFFNVCDRLDCRDWVAKSIRGEPADIDPNQNGVMTQQQRAMVYRWFGYQGGTRALDAIVVALAPNPMSTPNNDAATWCGEAMWQAIRCKAAMAVCALEIDQTNAIQLLKLALRQQSVVAATSARQHKTPMDLAKNIEAFIAQFPSASG